MKKTMKRIEGCNIRTESMLMVKDIARYRQKRDKSGR